MDIPLTQGKVAHVDPEDWPLIAAYQWYAMFTGRNDRWYAVATPLDGKNPTAKIKMHNLIMGIKNVDHRNGNGLDNQRLNLRPCTNALNQQNTGARGGSSSFKGVSWNALKRKWRGRSGAKGDSTSSGTLSRSLWPPSPSMQRFYRLPVNSHG